MSYAVAQKPARLPEATVFYACPFFTERGRDRALAGQVYAHDRFQLAACDLGHPTTRIAARDVLGAIIQRELEDIE